jgi:hypothetical protein
VTSRAERPALGSVEAWPRPGRPTPRPQPGAATIQVADTPEGINLDLALLALSGTILIDGPGAVGLTVRRNVATGFAVLSVAVGADVEVRGLSVSNGSRGRVTATGANLRLTGVTISGNVTNGGC